MLFQCCFAKQLWEDTGLYNVVFTGVEETGLEIFKRVFTSATKYQCAMVGMFCWGLWVRRNKWVWEKVVMSIFGVKHMAMQLLSEWNRARMKEEEHQNRSGTRNRNWSKPSAGWVKVNIDAACPQGCNFVVVACVVRDGCGSFLRAHSNIITGVRTPREAEAMSMREALSWVKNWRSTQCVFESDSKLLIDAIHGPSGKSLFDTIVDDCSELVKHYDGVLFEFVPRSANSVAHELARVACSSSGLREYYDIAPEFILCNLEMDLII